MEISIFLARVIGLYLVIVIPSILLNRKFLDRMIKESSENLAFIYFTGFFHLILGLLVLVVHNTWSGDWRLLITLIGWAGVLKGIIRLYAPHKVPAIASKVGMRTLVVWCVIFLIVGLYLLSKGFVNQA